jgi:hypothetical protein
VLVQRLGTQKFEVFYVEKSRYIRLQQSILVLK